MSVVIQYIDGCPNSASLIERTMEAISLYDGPVQYSEVIVKSNEEAEKIKFRGSPTLLINDRDFEGLQEVDSPGLTCRYYANGLPTRDEILARLG